jgi:dethiobiotin synthetase
LPGVFVSGTDTGVGKTFVSCALARGLREAGVDVGVMKPVETGVPPSGPEDALALREAAAVDDELELICPLQYAMPAAPQAAARAEGRAVSIARIDEAFAVLQLRHAAMLVEGAGGLLVPFDSATTMRDLARRLGLPILLVARASLGTINHTLLSIEACQRDRLDLLGVVISHSAGALSKADAANLEILREALGSRLIGEALPHESGKRLDPATVGLEAVIESLEAARRG